MNFKNKYNSVLIINPELSYMGDIEDKIKGIVGTDIIAYEDLGIRQLAYNISNKDKGHYIRIEFYGDSNREELDKYFKINSDIMKYIIVKTKDIHEYDEYNEQLYKILDIYTENSWEDEPLNEDEVDRLTELLRVKLDLINGNITQEEYDKIIGV